MTKQFTAIDLGRLPAPQFLAEPSVEEIFAERKARLIECAPYTAEVLELSSDPLVKFIEAESYREAGWRREFNEQAMQNLLAFCTGEALDHFAANFNVIRAVVQAGIPTATPPVPEILESDDRLRSRVQLAQESYSTAGSSGSYIFWGLSASSDVKDIGVDAPRFGYYELDPAIAETLPDDVIVLRITYDAGLSDPMPGDVAVNVLGAIGNGTATPELLAAVDSALSADEVRPMTDRPRIGSAEVVTYEIEATLTLYEGPDPSVAKDVAEDRCVEFAARLHKLGHDINTAALYHALYVDGAVQNVTLTKPAADIVIADNQAAYCTKITVNVGGRDV